jgi:uncharacterized protein (DUF3820 family)
MSEFDTSFIANPKIPWGKYEGTELKDLPTDYLLWLLEKAENDSLRPGWLNQAVKEAWRNQDNSDFKAEAERLRKENSK